MKNLFDSFNISTIDSYIATKQEENLQLDFKQINTDNLSHSDDKKNLAKAISGFANSDGGIIVWGVVARKNEDGIDCAQEKKIINNLPLFISRINELTGRSINPIVDGIMHKGVFINKVSGFAVTLIPPSDSGPHMAKLGEDRYYKRSGDSFYRMEHFDIEDMFGRRKKPKLELLASLSEIRKFQGRITINAILSLINSGRGTAHAPYLEIKTPDGCEWGEYGYNGSGAFGLDPLFYYAQAKTVRFSSDSVKVVHPNVKFPITSLKILLKENNIQEQIKKDISIEYSSVAEDVAMKNSILNISSSEICSIIKKNNINVNA